MKTQLENALAFANNNVKVFPLSYNSKSEQILSSWKNEATTDVNQIKKWFENTDCNLAIRTGNGLAVIDVDVKNSEEGKKLILEKLKEFPNTFTVQTPSGGYHFYYRVDRLVKCRVRVHEEIDIRGENGYVVGPGSCINGKFYEIKNNVPIAQATESVYSFMEGYVQTKQRKIISSGQYLEGQRNDYLFRMACSLQSKGLDDDAICSAISIENEKKCYPPLKQSEIERLCKSSMRYEKGNLTIKNEVTCTNRYTACELINAQEDESLEIVENMLSVGVAILGAPQKTGKTFFCIQLADSIVNGTNFLGRKVVQGSALYLAFEDHKTMIQKRLKRMGIKPNDQFVIDVLKSNSEFDLNTRIQQEKEINPDLRLVVIDTFAKIRKSIDRDYETEYKEVSSYHELAFQYNIVIVLVTHLRKEINVDQPFDAIYGSRGLTAGADSILVMYKRNHISNSRQLSIQGKDIPDDEITLVQNENCMLVVSEDEFDEQIDDNLSKIINYIVENKNYIGSHDALCSKLKLNIRGKGLQTLLKKNIDLLKDSNIYYEVLPRTSKARQMKMTYLGDEAL